jgi:hypothetical protein
MRTKCPAALIYINLITMAMPSGVGIMKVICFFFFNGSTAPLGPRPPHFEASRSHTLDTPRSVGLLWTSDQPVAETST